MHANSFINVEVYIWRGRQVNVPTVPQVVFNNLRRVSPGDNYIAIELSNEIRSYITSSNLNQNNPQWAYNATESPTTSGEGVYFQILYKSSISAQVLQLGTFFATTGYRYSFEQKGGYYTTFQDAETFRKYARSINYDRNVINLSTVVATSQSGTGANGMIKQDVIDPAIRNQQTGVKCILAYVNRLGLWDTFTPFGKFVENSRLNVTNLRHLFVIL